MFYATTFITKTTMIHWVFCKNYKAQKEGKIELHSNPEIPLRKSFSLEETKGSVSVVGCEGDHALVNPLLNLEDRVFLLKSKLVLITIYKDPIKKQNIIHFVLSSLNILHNP